MTFKPYCNSLTRYSRRNTREVKIGHLGIGGQNPIRVQSMTTTDTMDTGATVEQSIRMIEAGCELVRITAPSLKEAENLKNIKKELIKRGYQTPLVADIHFTPNAAELAARIVEKVRVNPGNYADRKRFESIDYSNDGYDAELERIRERFTPLVKICKEYGTAMRIGTNHGSLSDRIMSRYGDTAHGMVESALEFVRICEDLNYHDIVLSMKSSNPIVMVQAYRLLVNRMLEEDMNYPLHLGVTEAGEGEDGRIKSAVGIGALLEDGLGDTIRVSLTEDPEFELPVAKALVNRYSNRTHKETAPMEAGLLGSYYPYEYKRRQTKHTGNIGGEQVPRVVADLSHNKEILYESFESVGYRYSEKLDKWHLSDQAADYIYTGNQIPEFDIPGTLGLILDATVWYDQRGLPGRYPLFSLEQYLASNIKSEQLNFVKVSTHNLDDDFLNFIINDPTVVLVIESENINVMADCRHLFLQLMHKEIQSPVIIFRNFESETTENIQLYGATDCGALLVDGFGDGVWLGAQNGDVAFLNKTSFGILQATRTRISKTEYISCPSCGRTLFDLQETTARIRSRTDHLKGVKIGIMGCIVNGPGEMADADYGYVGTGPGKITLYKGREVVRRNVPAAEAVDALINLIREHGDWAEVEMVEI